jgi:hypothetical protein
LARFIRTAAHPGGRLPELSPAAGIGEWAVPGGFAFWDVPAEQLGDNFRHGFYGLDSYAWSPLVEIAELSDGELDQVRLQLAMHLIHAHGAPGLGAAYAYVDQEIEQTLALCTAPLGTLLTVERRLEGDEIHEDYKRVQMASTDVDHGAVRIWGPESMAAKG